jgi:predicted metalloprotease with PDZ domain
VAQASLDAWVKYYRQDENTPNATVSYYTKGSLVALCLDLSLRQSSNTSLDAVMRALWHRCQGGPMTEDDLIAVLQALSGRSYASEIAQWVHGTDELPMQPLLEAQGIRIEKEPAALAQQLGLRVAESTGIQIKSVLRGSAAEQAGFAAGDEWLGITLGSGVSSTSWRIHKLDDLTLYSANASHIQALVSRDKRLLTLSLTLPEAVTTWKLVVQDQPVVKLWLGHSD